MLQTIETKREVWNHISVRNAEHKSASMQTDERRNKQGIHQRHNRKTKGARHTILQQAFGTNACMLGSKPQTDQYDAANQSQHATWLQPSKTKTTATTPSTATNYNDNKQTFQSPSGQNMISESHLLFCRDCTPNFENIHMQRDSLPENSKETKTNKTAKGNKHVGN